MSSATTEKNRRSTSNINFHQGLALLQIAKAYPTLSTVIYEAVQNALDSNAKTIFINIDYRKRILSIRDNGDGATREQFEEALTSICSSQKDKNSLGQFGIGLISPVGKCDKFTFTSAHKSDSSSFREWAFITEDLKKQGTFAGIPIYERSDLVYGYNKTVSKGKIQVIWRTEVMLHNFTSDRVTSKTSCEELKDGIIEKFGEKIRRLGAGISIKIVKNDKTIEEESFQAPEFDGKKLPVTTYESRDAGKTNFHIFLTKKTSKGRNGKILVGIKDDLYRVSFKSFCNVAREFISSEVIELLEQGIFEGTILSEKCKLLKERTGFEINDALVDFCTHLEKWCREEGQQYYREINDKQQDERYQNLGLKTMKKLEEMLEQDQYKPLLDVIRNAKYGTIGVGHTDFSEITKKEKDHSLTTKALIEKGFRVTKNKESCTNGSSNNHYEGMEHNTVKGLRGTRRKLIKGESTGLHFSFDEMSGQSKLWEFDSKRGVLSFNVRHPLFERASRKDWILVRFLEYISITALILETMPRECRSYIEMFTDEHVKYELFLIEKGHHFSNRKK